MHVLLTRARAVQFEWVVRFQCSKKNAHVLVYKTDTLSANRLGVERDLKKEMSQSGLASQPRGTWIVHRDWIRLLCFVKSYLHLNDSYYLGKSEIDRIKRDCPIKRFPFTDEKTEATPIVEFCSGYNTGRFLDDRLAHDVWEKRSLSASPTGRRGWSKGTWVCTCALGHARARWRLQNCSCYWLW